MKYELEIKLIKDPAAEDCYPNKAIVYSQTIDDLDVRAVIAVANKLTPIRAETISAKDFMQSLEEAVPVR